MCAIAAPAVFGSDDYGNAVVLIPGDLPADLEAAARRAEGNCPGGRSRSTTDDERPPVSAVRRPPSTHRTTPTRDGTHAMTDTKPVQDWTTDYDIFDAGFVRDPYPAMADVRESGCPVAHTDR